MAFDQEKPKQYFLFTDSKPFDTILCHVQFSIDCQGVIVQKKFHANVPLIVNVIVTYTSSFFSRRESNVVPDCDSRPVVNIQKLWRKIEKIPSCKKVVLSRLNDTYSSECFDQIDQYDFDKQFVVAPVVAGVAVVAGGGGQRRGQVARKRHPQTGHRSHRKRTR